MIDQTIERLSAVMIRNNTEIKPFEIVLPEGYRMVDFSTGDEKAWAEIETSVGEFPAVSTAMQAFQDEFGQAIWHMKKRCIFIENQSGMKVATITAWYGIFFDGSFCNRIHWVAVLPTEQGKGLGKILLCAAMNRFQVISNSKITYLTTSTASWKAVRLYQNFGFQPYFRSNDDQKAWDIIHKKLEGK